MKKQEKERIYQEWLAGAWISELARKYHHWRSTIEMVVAEQAAESLPATLWKRLLELAQSRGKEVERLRRVCAAHWFSTIGELDGEEAQRRWIEDYNESCAALNAKASAMKEGKTWTTPVWLYDDYGIPVDVVPFRPDQDETAPAEGRQEEG